MVTVNQMIYGIILLVAVAIPITQTVIDDSNLTGISATVVSFIPAFLALGALAFAGRFTNG